MHRPPALPAPVAVALWRALLLPLIALAALLLAACGSDRKSFSFSSPDVPSGGTISNAQVFDAFGCSGENVSPELRWNDPPAGTQSFAITVYDPDAPTGSGFWHWTVFDLPASARSIPRGAATAGLPQGAIQGYTDFGSSTYGGPCPPEGDPAHRYQFTLYALRVASLQLPADAPAALVSFNARANAIDSRTFTATYGRPGTPPNRQEIPTFAGFTLESAEIAQNGTIANAQVFNSFGCSGGNVSPSLSWGEPPPGTQGFVLMVYDPDAPTGSGFWHWLVFDIPGSARSIAANAGTTGGTPGGGTQAKTDFGFSAYGGPCPPQSDGPHRYQFTLYAVGDPDLAALGLGPTATGGFVGFVTRANAIAKAELQATYDR